MAKKKCYDEGGLTFTEMSDEDRSAAARDAIAAIHARQRPEAAESEEKSEVAPKRVTKPAVKKEATPKVESKPEPKEERPVRAERAPSSVKVEPITGPAPAVSRQAAMPDIAARKAETAARVRRSAFGGENKGVYGMKAGGKVSSASKRADGCAIRGKTKGRIV